MKKILFAPLAFMAFCAQAQTPPNKLTPIVQKATATWCGPCGTWGWEFQDSVVKDNAAKAIIMECYGSSSSLFYNQAAHDLSNWNQSWPNWAFNNVNRTVFDASGAIYTWSTRGIIKNAVDSFVALAPVASTGYKYRLSGNVFTINTITKFWQPGSGTYYLSAYMIEDSVWGIQTGQTGAVYHRNVLRGSVTTSTFGDSLASGTIPAGQTFAKDFSFTITDVSWRREKVKVVVVVWKKNGSNYDFINANNIPDVPVQDTALAITGIEAVHDLAIVPNPASNKIMVRGSSITGKGLHLVLTNTVGQVIYSKTLEAGQIKIDETVNLENVVNGLYQLTIYDGDGAVSSRKIVVAK